MGTYPRHVLYFSRKFYLRQFDLFPKNQSFDPSCFDPIQKFGRLTRVVKSNSNYQFQFQLSVFNSNSNYAFSRFSIPIPITKNKTNSNSNYAAKFSIPIPIPTKIQRFFAILKFEIKLINCNSFLNCSMLSKFILKSKTLVILLLTN